MWKWYLIHLRNYCILWKWLLPCPRFWFSLLIVYAHYVQSFPLDLEPPLVLLQLGQMIWRHETRQTLKTLHSRKVCMPLHVFIFIMTFNRGSITIEQPFLGQYLLLQNHSTHYHSFIFPYTLNLMTIPCLSVLWFNSIHSVHMPSMFKHKFADDVDKHAYQPHRFTINGYTKCNND